MVLEAAKNTTILKNLNISFSYEGGFTLPLTEEWLIQPLKNSHLLKYHSVRQLRFAHMGNSIVGLRFKDAINYWTDAELNELENLLQNVVESL